MGKRDPRMGENLRIYMFSLSLTDYALKRESPSGDLECPHCSGPPFGIELSRFQEGDEMAGKREKPEDIVLKLRQVEVLQGQGKSVQEAVRQIGVTISWSAPIGSSSLNVSAWSVFGLSGRCS